MNKKKAIIIASVAVVIGIILFLFLYKRNDMPSERRMAQIMADLYVADAMAQTKGNLFNNLNKNDKTIEKLYHTILDHYGITKQSYDSALAWYSKDPRRFAKVYERVVDVLSKREADFKIVLDKRDSVRKVIDKMNDSINTTLEKRSKSIHYPIEERDHLDGKKDLKFEYTLDSVSGGKITHLMKYLFPRQNNAKDPKLVSIVKYDDKKNDTISIDLIVSQTQKTAEITFQIREDAKAVKYETTLMKCKDYKQLITTITDLDIKYIPYLITDSIEFDEILIPPYFAY